MFILDLNKMWTSLCTLKANISIKIVDIVICVVVFAIKYTGCFQKQKNVLS